MGNAQNFNPLDRLIRTLRLRKILPYLPPNAAVCDVGCGDGTILKHLCESGRIAWGTGLDPCAIPAKGFPCEIIRADILGARLPPESYQAVLMLAVLEHLEGGKVEETMKEIHRILKPDGLLILTTPTPRSEPLLEFLAFRLHVISEREIRGHRHYYRRAEMAALAQLSGFDILKASNFQAGLNSLYVFRKKGSGANALEPPAPGSRPA